MKKLLAILILIFSLSACDESTNPSDDSYAIEKTLTENAMTQELTSGDDIKITVIGGTIKEETEIKVKKVSASDVPNLTLDKTTIGKNIFKIKIKGQKTFSPALKIEIKYDDEYLKSKNLTTADIKGLVHLPSGWVLGDYTIDQTNKKIIFSISSTSLPSKVKDELLVDEDEITICDGYTTTDSGSQDDKLFALLKSYKYCEAEADASITWSDGSTSRIFDGDGSGVKFRPHWSWNETHPPLIKWDGLKVDVTFPDYQEVYYHIYGEFNQDGTIKEMTMIFQDDWDREVKISVKDILGKTDYENKYIRYYIPIYPSNETRQYITDLRVTDFFAETKVTASSIDWTSTYVRIIFTNTPDVYI